MKAILIPAILALMGGGAGVGAGLALQPAKQDLALQTDNPCGDAPETNAAAPAPEPDIGPARDYARLNNQFVVPVIEGGRVAAMIVMSLQVEVRQGNMASVFAVEPKLRDGFLQNMFDHANNGGFAGNFTSGTNMRALRSEFLITARSIVGPEVTDVLIMDIMRQDM